MRTCIRLCWTMSILKFIADSLYITYKFKLMIKIYLFDNNFVELTYFVKDQKFNMLTLIHYEIIHYKVRHLLNKILRH
jgi:hypothetical protein